MKTMIFLLLIFLFITDGFQSIAQSKKMCITIDDLPGVQYGIKDSAYSSEIIYSIVRAADSYHVPIIGYVVEGAIYNNGKPDSSKIKLIDYWVKNGYDLGNHTYSHMDYNTVTLDKYIKDIVNGEYITKGLTTKYNKKLIYFRHPYLHSGQTKMLSDALNMVLDSLGYIASPVTIDTDDYIFAKAYHNAYINADTKNMKFIGKQYIAYMEKKLIHFEYVSYTLYQRTIDQTLLIHANLLNARYLESLLLMYKRHGYVFISQSEVLQDKVYSEPIIHYSKKGNSWLYRWASNGNTTDLTLRDPKVPEAILKLYK